MKPMRNIRILTAILLLLFLVVVIPGIVSNYFSLTYVNETLETKEKKLQSRVTIHLSQQIRSYVENYQHRLKLIGRSVSLIRESSPGMDPFDILKKAKVVEKYISEDPNFRALYILNEKGRGTVASPPGLSAEILEDLQNGFESAIKGEDFIGRHFFLDAYPDTVLTLAQPIYRDDGSMLGVIEILLSLAPMQDLLPRPEEGMESYVVDTQGGVVLHGNPRIMLSRTDKDRAADYSQVTIVQDYMRSPFATVTKRYDFARGIGVGTDTVLGTVAPVGKPNWGVVVQRNTSVALREGWLSIKRALLIGVVTILVAFLLGYFFAMVISSPLRILADRTKQMAEGDFSARVPLMGTREINTLSDNFNHMAEQIQDYINKLKIAARENRDLFLHSIQMISSAIDAKDPYTKGHSERVRKYTLAIARELGFSSREIEELNVAALLHDVGKIGIDDRVLRKPSVLNDEEYNMIKKHPSVGAMIMEQVPHLEKMIPGIKYHHENWGGGGYPDGLKGEQIPLFARVISVADTFDAMTTDRPYQKAMSPKYAAEKIRSLTGKRFEPTVVEAFLRAFEKGELSGDDKIQVA